MNLYYTITYTICMTARDCTTKHIHSLSRILEGAHEVIIPHAYSHGILGGGRDDQPRKPVVLLLLVTELDADHSANLRLRFHSLLRASDETGVTRVPRRTVFIFAAFVPVRTDNIEILDQLFGSSATQNFSTALTALALIVCHVYPRLQGC